MPFKTHSLPIIFIAHSLGGNVVKSVCLILLQYYSVAAALTQVFYTGATLLKFSKRCLCASSQYQPVYTRYILHGNTRIRLETRWLAKLPSQHQRIWPGVKWDLQGSMLAGGSIATVLFNQWTISVHICLWRAQFQNSPRVIGPGRRGIIYPRWYVFTDYARYLNPFQSIQTMAVWLNSNPLLMMAISK